MPPKLIILLFIVLRLHILLGFRRTLSHHSVVMVVRMAAVNINVQSPAIIQVREAIYVYIYYSRY